MWKEIMQGKHYNQDALTITWRKVKVFSHTLKREWDRDRGEGFINVTFRSLDHPGQNSDYVLPLVLTVINKLTMGCFTKAGLNPYSKKSEFYLFAE